MEVEIISKLIIKSIEDQNEKVGLKWLWER